MPLLYGLKASGKPGPTFEGKGKPLKISGMVYATGGFISGEIALKEHGVPLSGAKVMIGKTILQETSPGQYRGGGPEATTLNTIVTVRIWRRPGANLSLAQSADYVGTSQIQNWLRLLYPKPGEAVAIPLSGQIELRWAFSGGTEKSCLSLKGPGYSYWHCQTDVKHDVNTAQMPHHVQIRWESQIFFSDFAFTPMPAPGSQVGFVQMEAVAFNTL